MLIRLVSLASSVSSNIYTFENFFAKKSRANNVLLFLCLRGVSDHLCFQVNKYEERVINIPSNQYFFWRSCCRISFSSSLVGQNRLDWGRNMPRRWLREVKQKFLLPIPIKRQSIHNHRTIKEESAAAIYPSIHPSMCAAATINTQHTP